MEDLAPLLNGYVRAITFMPLGFKVDKKTVDPNAAETNLIIEIFEGYYENGGVSKESRYGRWF
jgi:hypothetical protein